MPCKSHFGFLATAIIAALMVVLTVALPGVSADGDEGKNEQAAQSQEQALPIPEKAELKYPNLGSHLDGLVVQVEGGETASEDAASEAPVHSGESVAVTIYLTGNVDDVVSFLEDNGGDPRNVGEDYIEAYVPVTLLGLVSEQPGVIRVREIVPPEPEYGPITSQGVQAHGSAVWNQAGYSGQGIKVGIIDTGFEGFRSLMGTELPATVVARCYTDIGDYTQNLSDCENEDVHGTAVAEAVMDIAPEVSLYIANPISWADLQSAADWMVSEGVTVINHSVVRIFDGPGDGTSPISHSPTNTVDRVVDGGVNWINAAGNDARKTWFSDSPTIYTSSISGVDFVAVDSHEDVTNGLYGLGGNILIQLRWDDRWDGATSDLDMGLFDFTQGEYVGEGGADRQAGGIDHRPLELLGHRLVYDRLYGIVVIHRSGSVPDWVQVNVFSGNVRNGRIEHYTEEGSIASPAESKKLGMLTVGATHYWDTHTIAGYSSRGPTPDGRFKPDIVGTACGKTASYGHYLREGQDCWFAGTSQAAPHVAGLAALVRQRFPDYTAEQTAAYLKDHAERRGAVPNNTWGHGFAQLPSSQIPEAQKEAERAALVALYNATGGANWTNNANWVSAQPVGRWHGVTIGPSGQVVGLSLPENGLTGEIPSELGGLADLTWLNLNQNELRGEIPSELGNLANLEMLSLWSNQLSGGVPAWLGSLSNLNVLSLSYNQLTGEIPPELGSLANLKRLILNQNQLTGQIPSQLDNLANLEELYLWGNELSGAIPPELSNLSNLKDLYLSKNQLSGAIPPELYNLANLEVIALNENSLSGEIPSELGRLTKLTGLYLHSNQLNGRMPSELGNLVNLANSGTGGNQSSAGIPSEHSGLASLAELDLGRNRWIAVIPSEPGDLAILEGLSLQRQPVERSSIPSELGNLSGLERLWLYDNQLSGAIPSELGNLANLEELYLWDNRLSGEIPVELGSLSNLKGLGIGGNELLSGCVPTSLKGQLDMSRSDLGGLPFCGDTAPTAPSATDRAALVAFYHATDGPNWKNDNKWLTAAPIGLWYGVTVDDNGRVTELALSRNQLSGEIPPELGNLSSLENLLLWSNQLAGPIPARLGNLANLTELSLSENQLTGEIPPELGNLASLGILHLWGNQLTGEIPEELGNLAELTVLTLSRNDLTGEIPTELGELTNLAKLFLNGNQLTGSIPSTLSNLAKLEELDLGDNQLTGHVPTWLGNLTNLEELYLTRNQLSGPIPPELGGGVNLSILALGGNGLTGEIPGRLGDLTNLTELFLWGNQLNGKIPPELGNLANLEILEFGGNELTGEIPPQLGRLANLKSLNLRINRLTGEIPTELGSLSNLVFLDLHSNHLTGTLPDSLIRMTALTGFLFYNNPGLCAPVDDAFQEWLESIADTIGSSCAPADSLEDKAVLVELHRASTGVGWGNSANWLSDRPVREWHGVTTDAGGRVIDLLLGGNQLTGEIPAELGSLAMLERLWFHNNQLSGEIPSELGSLANLEELYLFDNQLTGNIPTGLGDLTNLAHLRLDNNRLTGEIPAELSHLENLTLLYLSGNQLTGCVPAGLQDVADNDFAQLGLDFCTSGTYDRDNDGVISITELFDAIDDYFAGEISITELFDVIDAYFGG